MVPSDCLRAPLDTREERFRGRGARAPDDSPPISRASSQPPSRLVPYARGRVQHRFHVISLAETDADGRTRGEYTRGSISNRAQSTIVRESTLITSTASSRRGAPSSDHDLLSAPRRGTTRTTTHSVAERDCVIRRTAVVP